MKYDVVVLGAGPGGYTAAFRAADLGLKVGLIEREAVLGGVCLNVGCIPSKSLLHAAKIIEDARAARTHGIAFSDPTIDLDALRSWKDGTIARLSGGLASLAKQRRVDVIAGTGQFASPHSLAVDGAHGRHEIEFEKAIIAAGSTPIDLPDIDAQHERIWDSTKALALEKIPSCLLVIGGGIIGLEMATVYAALGASVTIVELLEGLMVGVDRDLVAPLEKHLAKTMTAIYTRTRVAQVQANATGVRVSLEGDAAPEQAEFDHVLVAIGRRPNGNVIGATAAGVGVDERGYIAVDKHMRTNVAHIFAIGDIVGQPMLAHKAVHEGKVAAEVAAGRKAAFEARAIPSVAYTDPEVAWVGVTESEAKTHSIAYEKGVFPWAASGRALSMGRGTGLTKLLFDTATNRVIGGGVVGVHAGDVIAEIGLAIEMGCDAEDIALTVHAHPTLAETVAMAAEAQAGTITDLLPVAQAAKG